MMDSLFILFVHGSREPAWCVSFDKLVQELEAKLGKGSVALAFLDHSSPTFEETVKIAARDGVKSLVVLPLFFSGAGHVNRDVPKVISEALLRHPELDIKIQPAMGEWPEFADMIALRLKSILRTQKMTGS